MHKLSPAALERRQFLQYSLGVALLTGLPLSNALHARATTPNHVFAVQKTPEEWKAILTPEQYAVLREHDTERPNTSPLLQEKRAGIYHCAGCDYSLYDAATKYESGTGWPSFYQALPNAVGTQEDNSWFSKRTEVHCQNCGGHLGHIFDDGPKPTGMRHCINGVALSFKPKAI